MQLLKIRYYQAKRDMGIWVFVIAACAFGLSYYIVSSDIKRNLIFLSAILMAFVSFHNKRIDLNFIQKYFSSPSLSLFVTYNLTMFPLSLGFIVNGFWQYAILLHIVVSGFCIIKTKTSASRYFFVVKWVPSAHFEWIAGIRSNLLILIVLAIVMLILSPVKLFALVALFLFNTILTGFYNQYEPRLMLNPENLPVSAFLNNKVRFFMGCILITNAPILIINSIFQNDTVWFNLFFLIGFMLLAASTVYMKYAGYKPNSNPGFSFDVLILYTSVIIPFLLPLALYILFTNLKKARLNLLNYLDDNS